MKVSIKNNLKIKYLWFFILANYSKFDFFKSLFQYKMKALH